MENNTEQPENMQFQIVSLAKEIDLLKARNLQVEKNKAWETSKTRKMAVLLLTYLIMSLLMHSIGSMQPLLDAIIPSLGYFLSTLSLPLIKNLWLKHAP